MENYDELKKKYEELLQIEESHRLENGKLRKRIKELEQHDIDLISVYIDGVYNERSKWLNKIKTNKEILGDELTKLLLMNMEV